MFKLKTWDKDWYYCKSDGDTRYGLNDAAWDMFSGNPFKYLAREICQNSIDVRLDKSKPVVVEFHSFDIDQFQVPQFSELKDALERSKTFWSDQENDPAVSKFINNALKTIENDKIHCLRISDWNTTGLTGSQNANGRSPWFSLVKGTGISDKPAGSGGSKGVGKYAPYACSDVRTVFYSTKAADNLEASEGVSRLVSFIDKDEKLTTGLGYYSDGTPARGPIKQFYSLDPEFARAEGEFGTDIFVIGFRKDDEWIDKVTGSVLDGFLYAIMDERLVVKVDKRVINKANLAELFKNVRHEYIIEYADEYYKVLTDKHTQTFPPQDIELKGRVIGRLKLKALLNPDFSRTCAMVRQVGMKIKDQTRFPSFIYFSAVLYIEGNELNNYLRSLENSAHTAWEPERISDPKEKKEAQGLIKRINKFVRDSVLSLRATSSGKTINLAIGECLSADVPDKGKDNGKKEDPTDEVSNVSVTTITKTQKSREKEQDSEHMAIGAEQDNSGDQTPAPGEGSRPRSDKPIAPDSHPGDGTSGYEETGPDTPEEKLYKFVLIASSKTRVFCKNRDTGEYTVVFTPKESSSKAYLDIFLSAESQNYQAEIASATLADGSKLPVNNGKVEDLTFEKDYEVKLNVKMKWPGLYAMEVKGYGNKK